MTDPHVLIVGGTGFVGSWTSRAAVDAGCRVTVLNRGQTPADLPPEVAQLHADRDGELSALGGLVFDAVIDVVPYQPEQVDRLLSALGDRVGHYTLVSSISAVDLSGERVLETDPGISPRDPAALDYGEAKAACERLVAERLGERGLVVRPGLIGGPGDHTDRATHWARRAAAGGVAVAPGSPADLLQLIDVRDLAPFLVQATTDRISGVLHGVGHPTLWGDFLYDIAEQLKSEVDWRWVSAQILAGHQVRAWTDLPAWVPSVGPFSGACKVDRTRADEAGLFTRNPATTAVDAWRWRRANPEGDKNPGLSAERERALLATLEGP